MSLINVADTFTALQPAPTDRLRRLVAVLAAPVVKLAAVKRAAFRMTCFVMVDAAGAVVRLFVHHETPSTSCARLPRPFQAPPDRA